MHGRTSRYTKMRSGRLTETNSKTPRPLNNPLIPPLPHYTDNIHTYISIFTDFVRNKYLRIKK